MRPHAIKKHIIPFRLLRFEDILKRISQSLHQSSAGFLCFGPINFPHCGQLMDMLSKWSKILPRRFSQPKLIKSPQDKYLEMTQ